MTAAGEWTLRRFAHVIPADQLTEDERQLVGMWLSAVAVNPAGCGILLPSNHLGTTYPEEHEDYEPGFENLWSATIPGTDWRCEYQIDYAERTVVCWTFERLPPQH
jgi:hypothetical protein